MITEKQLIAAICEPRQHIGDGRKFIYRMLLLLQGFNPMCLPWEVVHLRIQCPSFKNWLRDFIVYNTVQVPCEKHQSMLNSYLSSLHEDSRHLMQEKDPLFYYVVYRIHHAISGEKGKPQSVRNLMNVLQREYLNDYQEDSRSITSCKTV